MPTVNYYFSYLLMLQLKIVIGFALVFINHTISGAADRKTTEMLTNEKYNIHEATCFKGVSCKNFNLEVLKNGKWVGNGYFSKVYHAVYFFYYSNNLKPFLYKKLYRSESVLGKSTEAVR